MPIRQAVRVGSDLQDGRAGDVILGPLHLDDGNTAALLLSRHRPRLQVPALYTRSECVPEYTVGSEAEQGGRNARQSRRGASTRRNNITTMPGPSNLT